MGSVFLSRGAREGLTSAGISGLDARMSFADFLDSIRRAPDLSAEHAAEMESESFSLILSDMEMEEDEHEGGEPGDLSELDGEPAGGDLDGEPVTDTPAPSTSPPAKKAGTKATRKGKK